MDNGISLFAGYRPERTSTGSGAPFRSGEVPHRKFEDLFLRSASEGRSVSGTGREELVRLGTITEETPTVSHLLMRDSRYREQCWDIVHAPANRDKPFSDMAKGESVWLDPRNREIITRRDTSGRQSADSGESHKPSPSLSSLFHRAPSPESKTPHLTPHDLSRAVASYRGTPYSRLNCYELVVQGLKDLGVDYSGRQGLQRALMQEARQDERAPNAYLTGEGLIRSLGSSVFRQNLPRIDSPQGTARDLMRSLDHRLQPGMILSLSTPQGGHTGVISRQEGRWTFVNSGRIQHAVNGEPPSRGVAEEDLSSELAQWLERARNNGHSLTISVGRLSPEKVSRFTHQEKNVRTTA